jgi:hypothetical protein
LEEKRSQRVIFRHKFVRFKHNSFKDGSKIFKV